MRKKKNQMAKPASTYEQFKGMTEWMMKGMEKEPRSEREMFAQATQASIKTFIFSGWIFAKLLRPVLKLIKEGLRMVFGRKKKEDKNDPSFVSPMAAQQMEAFNRQMMQGGYPFQQPPVQPQVQAYGYPQQPMGMPPAPQMQQPMQPQMPQPAPQMQQPMQPYPPRAAQAEPSVLEQLMMADMGLSEHLKGLNTRLTALEETVQKFDLALVSVIERLNLIQGVQPSGGKKIKFQK